MNFIPKDMKGKVATVTMRSNQEGKPQITLSSKTNFPALDDLEYHLDKLQFAAQRLDKLPKDYWHSIDPTYTHKLPFYIPMQVIQDGKQHFCRRVAYMDRYLLAGFRWTESEPSDAYRNCAESGFRIINVYINLRKHFDKVGLPKGVTEF
jgi:hypothetical protein